MFVSVLAVLADPNMCVWWLGPWRETCLLVLRLRSTVVFFPFGVYLWQLNLLSYVLFLGSTRSLQIVSSNEVMSWLLKGHNWLGCCCIYVCKYFLYIGFIFSGTDLLKLFCVRMKILVFCRYPMEHGIVTDWNDMERIWQYIYSKDQLQTFAEEVNQSV